MRDRSERGLRQFLPRDFLEGIEEINRVEVLPPETPFVGQRDVQDAAGLALASMAGGTALKVGSKAVQLGRSAIGEVRRRLTDFRNRGQSIRDEVARTLETRTKEFEKLLKDAPRNRGTAAQNRSMAERMARDAIAKEREQGFAQAQFQATVGSGVEAIRTNFRQAIGIKDIRRDLFQTTQEARRGVRRSPQEAPDL